MRNTFYGWFMKCQSEQHGTRSLPVGKSKMPTESPVFCFETAKASFEYEYMQDV